MNCNESSKREIYTKLSNEVKSCCRKYILLAVLLAAAESIGQEMPAFLQSPEGQRIFNSAVRQLVEDSLLSPVGRKPKTTGGLYSKYKIINQIKPKDDELVPEMVRIIAPPAKLDYYLKNTQNYIEDREIITIISDFLRQKKLEPVTVNERAYELFGDEKFFKGAGKERSCGELILKRLGLNYQDIGCKETWEPFFSFVKKDFHLQDERKIYIIENKDTFWSFKENVMDGAASVTVDMLIYGEGRKILSSFKFIEEYEVSPKTDEVFYFGDLDPEGINIYSELAAWYPEYWIVPFYAGYAAMLDIGLKHPPAAVPKRQIMKAVNIKRFLTGFTQESAEKLSELFTSGCYIPQEALSAVEMRERFGR
jgi:hypothetical protein